MNLQQNCSRANRTRSNSDADCIRQHKCLWRTDKRSRYLSLRPCRQPGEYRGVLPQVDSRLPKSWPIKQCCRVRKQIHRMTGRMPERLSSSFALRVGIYSSRRPLGSMQHGRYSAVKCCPVTAVTSPDVIARSASKRRIWKLFPWKAKIVPRLDLSPT